jgi:hypothetical protein
LSYGEEDIGHMFNLTWECDFCHPYVGKKSPGNGTAYVLYFTNRQCS